ncbi:hypothetical protein [Nocardia grenadensis]|uniref:hypothetical protein n=1 Tax=Nocardia grenadensis TaxID=931537 RepID=UPI003D7421FE
MAKVISSLEGVVYAYRATGETVVLRAGDEIPADISLGSHLVESDKAEPKQAEPVEGSVTVTEKPAPKRRGRPARSAVADGASE